MSGSDPMSSLNTSSDSIIPGGVGKVESVRSRNSSGASSRQRRKAQGSGGVRSPQLWSPFRKHRDRVEVHHRPIEARVPQMFLLKFITIRNLMFMTIRFQRLPLVLTLLNMVEWLVKPSNSLMSPRVEMLILRVCQKRFTPKPASKFNNLLTMVQLLRNSCLEKDHSIDQFSNEVQLVQSQLHEQIVTNQSVLSQLASTKSEMQRLTGHKDSEVDVWSVKFDVKQVSLEESLAALSASTSAGQKPAAAEALRTADPVESGSLSMSDVVQNAMSSQLAPLFEAFQSLSSRIDLYDQQMSHNSAEQSHEQPPESILCQVTWSPQQRHIQVFDFRCARLDHLMVEMPLMMEVGMMTMTSWLLTLPQRKKGI